MRGGRCWGLDGTSSKHLKPWCIHYNSDRRPTVYYRIMAMVIMGLMIIIGLMGLMMFGVMNRTPGVMILGNDGCYCNDGY